MSPFSFLNIVGNVFTMMNSPGNIWTHAAWPKILQNLLGENGLKLSDSQIDHMLNSWNQAAWEKIAKGRSNNKDVLDVLEILGVADYFTNFTGYQDVPVPEETVAEEGFDFDPWTAHPGELDYGNVPTEGFDFTPALTRGGELGFTSWQQEGAAGRETIIPTPSNDLDSVEIGETTTMQQPQYQTTTPAELEGISGAASSAPALQVSNTTGVGGGAVATTGIGDAFDLFDFSTYGNFFEGGLSGIMESVTEGWDSFYSRLEPFVDMATDGAKIYSLYTSLDQLINPEKKWQLRADELNFMMDQLYGGTNPYERLGNSGALSGGLSSMIGAEAPNKMADLEKQKLKKVLEQLDHQNRKLLAEAIKAEHVNRNAELRAQLGNVVDALFDHLNGENGQGLTQNVRSSLKTLLEGFLSPDPDVNWISYGVQKLYESMGMDPNTQGAREDYQESIAR